MSIGKTMLGRRHVNASVVSSLAELMVEGTFPSGTYLVTVHHPVSSDDGDLEKALYGSFLPIPSKDLFPLPDPQAYDSQKMPGAIIPVKDGRITVKQGRKRMKLKITSKGDRPIQVRPHSRATRRPRMLTGYLGWLSLSPHRGQPSARIRPHQGVRLLPGHSCRHVRTI